jgi:hypothetical protein
VREEYPLEVVSGHLVVEIDGVRAILDTGSPLSFGSGTLSVLGQPVQLMGAELGVSPEYLSAKVGTRIDALLGLDVLGSIYFEIDTAAGTCVFDTEPRQISGVRIRLASLMGAPVVSAMVDGSAVQLILDTGAHIGYLTDKRLQGRRALGTREDFHPLMGEYPTEAHEVSVNIGPLGMSLVFGTMPPELELLIAMTDTDGVLGTDLFVGRKAWFALPDGELFLSELAA